MKRFFVACVFTMIATSASAQSARPEGRHYIGSAGLPPSREATADRRRLGGGGQASQAPSMAIETLQLTVADAVKRAVENNPDLEFVRLGTEVELRRVGETETAFTPVFSTLAGRSGNSIPPSNFFQGDRGVEVDDWFTSTGLRQRLKWGAGTWSLSWDTSRTASSDPFSNFDPIVQSGFQVAFSQPLLRDRKLDLVRQQNIIARRNLESAELRVLESVVQTVAAVKEAYWTLKASLANITVQQRSVELAQELVRQNKARVDIGQAPPIDLLQAEAEVAQRRENLIRANTIAEDAEDRLRRLIMDPGDTSFWRTRLNPIEEPAGSAPLPDVDAVVATAVNERYDVARARKELENAATNVDFLNDQKLPDVRFETSYRGSGLGGRQFLRTGGFPGTITGTRETGFGDVLGQVFDRSYPTWSMGVIVSYSLGRSYEEAGVARAQIERRQAAQRIASLQLQAAETIRQAARQVHSTAERIEAARAGAMLNEQRVDTEQKRYQAGLSTSFLVTQAQRDLLQAQVNLLQATLDHQSALVNFEALQKAPAFGSGETINARGMNVVLPAMAAPRGIFRQTSSAF